LFPDEFRCSLVDLIRKRRSDFKYLDDVTCFENLYSELGNYLSLVDSFADAFTSTFRFVRMYHCCRPIDVQSYYADGIRVLNLDYANEQFKAAVLGNPAFPQITEAHLETAFDEMRDSHMRDGYVYFGLDDRYLEEYGLHYLKKGSEYVQALGVIIRRDTGFDVNSFLTRQAQPTIFDVKIPVDDFGDQNIRELGPSVLFAWAYEITKETGTPFHIDFSIELDHDLSPEHINTHDNPTGTDAK